MSRTRAAVIWLALFVVAVTVGVVFQDGLPARVADMVPLLDAAHNLVPLTAAQQCARGTLTGKVTHVRDGDTIVVGGMPIRLAGLAAPEGDEPGGAKAIAAMRAMVDGRELRC